MHIHVENMQLYTLASESLFLQFISERLKWGEIAPQCLTVTKMIRYMRMKVL